MGSISKDTGFIFTQKYKDLQLLVLRGCSMFKDSEEFCVVHILNRFAVKMWFQGLLGMGFSSFEAWERCDPVDMICNLCLVEHHTRSSNVLETKSQGPEASMTTSESCLST